jgi:O-antigen/teichoic acid export membrane protein
MEVNYTRNYIKIYLWQGIAFVLNFLSMFIVIPFITSNKDVFGIYILCVSFSIYLAYADLGFIGAGQKYAAEHYIKNERIEEVETIGFVSFVLLVFLALFSMLFLALHLNPDLLIDKLTDADRSTAQSLFLILALSTPITLIQRQVQIIYGIRLKEFLVQRVNVLGNTLKIISVFWFFRANHYNIVEYFLFMQIINLMVALIALVYAKKLFDYDFLFLLKNIKFNKKVYLKTKKLAMNSLFLIATGILIYELDPTAIAFFLGTKQIAVYAIALTLLSFFRSFFSILFSPFNARFNHLTGSSDFKKLEELYKVSIINTFPLVVIPIFIIILLAKSIILTWVGEEYLVSVTSAQLLIACNVFAFIAYPTSILLVATERVKEMYAISAFRVLLYWCGIFTTINYWGVNSFALFKFLSFTIAAIFYFLIMIKLLKINIFLAVKKHIFTVFITLLYIVTINLFVNDYLPTAKSKFNFFVVLLYTVFLIVTSMLIIILTNVDYKNKIRKLMNFK